MWTALHPCLDVIPLRFVVVAYVIGATANHSFLGSARFFSAHFRTNWSDPPRTCQGYPDIPFLQGSHFESFESLVFPSTKGLPRRRVETTSPETFFRFRDWQEEEGGMLRLMVQKSQTTTWYGLKTLFFCGINYYPGGFLFFCKRVTHVIPNQKTIYQRSMVRVRPKAPRPQNKQDH